MAKRIQFILPLLVFLSSLLSGQEIVRVSDQFYAPNSLITLNNRLVFLARDSAGVNFWQYNGVNQPKRYSLLNNTDLGIPYQSDPVIFQNKIYVSLEGGQSGSDLWRFDGNNPPEEIVALSEQVSTPHDLTVAGNKLFFNAGDISHGRELWVYDGIEPPHIVTDILAGNSEHGISSNPYFLTEFGNKICFIANDGVHGNELWENDGANAARIIWDINEGPGDSYISNLALFTDKLYFAADDGIHGRELWMYDGTHDPSMITDLYPGSTSSNPNSLFVFMGKLYFNAEDDVYGKRLWSYDAMNQPSLVSESYRGSIDSDPVSMIVYHNKLYFSGLDEYDTGELWEYDGMTEPVKIADFATDYIYNTKPRNFIVNANRLYFTVGLKLFSFNGQNSPVPLDTLFYNTEPSHAVFEPDLISMNGKLYMISFDPEKREGLYVLVNAHSEIKVVTCGSYEFNGNVLSGTGTYIDTIPNYRGADSIITLSLVFHTLDTGVLQDQSVLISNDSLDAHQWISCDNDCLPIEGATGRIFNAPRSGHYAVIVSNGTCVDTSAIYAITITGVNNPEFSSGIRLYPNPTKGPVSIDLGKEYSDVEITIMSAEGRIESNHMLKNLQVTDLDLPSPAGIYILKVTSGNERAVFRIVKR